MLVKENKRRPSWNKMDEAQQDIPDDKIKRFASIISQNEENDPLFQATLKVLAARESKTKQHVSPEFIKKVVDTVKKRRDEIQAYKEVHQDETDEAAYLDQKVLKEMSEDLILRKAAKHLSESDVFLKGADAIKEAEEEEISKRVIAEILRSIKRLEDDFRTKNMGDEYDDIDMDDLEEITIPRTVITAIPRKLPSRKQETPLKHVFAKVDTGLRKPSRKKMSKTDVVEEEVKPIERRERLSSSISFLIDRTSGGSRIEGVDRDARTYPKIEEPPPSSDSEDGNQTLEEDENKEHQLKPPIPLHKPLKGLVYKTSEELLGLELMKPLANKIVKIGSKSKNQLPILEVVALSEYSKSIKKGNEIDEESKGLDNLQKKEDLIGAERVFDKLTHTAEYQEKDWDSILYSGISQRQVRTAQDRRFSYEKISYNSEAPSRQASCLMIKKLGKEVEPLSDLREATRVDIKSSKRCNEAVQKHTQRIANERLEKAMAALIMQTSTLPDNLRKQYIDNFLSGGKQGDVYLKIQREQLAQMRRHLKYIAAKSYQRASDIDRAEEEALSEEIKYLENRLRKSKPSEAIEREHHRRKLLTTDWDKSKIVESSAYWRNPPKGKKLVMKEYIPETTFEDILAQRGFFGRKIKREINSIYVPVTSWSDFDSTRKGTENEQLADSIASERESKNEELPNNQIIIEDVGKNAGKVEEKELTLQDVNKIKPIELRPFSNEPSQQRGSFQSNKNMMKVKRPLNADVNGGQDNQKTASKIELQMKKCATKGKPNQPTHRFANKTNKGFLRSFTKVYDVSDPKGL